MSTQRIVLAGGGGADDSVPLDQQLAAWLGPRAHLLYLPIALNNPARSFEGAYDWLSSTLAPFGLTRIALWTGLAGKTAVDLDPFDGIYIGGGNTYWLLHQIRAAAFGAALANFVAQGRPIYGGSAGAILLGRDIVTCAHLDQNSVGLTDTAGLDLLGGAAVWCHYRAADDPQIEALVARFTMPVLAISERAGIAREGDELRSVGYEAAFRFTATGRERIAPGERLHI